MFCTKVVGLFLCVNFSYAQPKLKIYISADMEGVAGVVSGEQLGPTGFEYQRFREFMTQEVNAAIGAAFKAGATEILVSDSHGNGQKNGISVPEAGVNAAIAGHFNVPVIMISGDDAICKEATALLGNLETAVVKWAYGFHSARTMTPEAACDLIREKVTRALSRLKEFQPYKVKAPIQFEVRFKNYRPSEVLSYLAIIERTDAHSIKFIGKDMVEVSKFFEFILTYEPGLSP
jgi:D-amino peptidase